MQLPQEGDYVTVMSETGYRHSGKNWALHKLPIDMKRAALCHVTLKQRSLPTIVETFMKSVEAVVFLKKVTAHCPPIGDV